MKLRLPDMIRVYGENWTKDFNFKYVELHKLVSTYDNENYYYNIDPISSDTVYKLMEGKSMGIVVNRDIDKYHIDSDNISINNGNIEIKNLNH